MKIVLLIGNGFDLGLGLRTSYGSFIDEYADLSKPNDPSSVEYALKLAISKNRLSWGDAEMAFAGLEFSKILKDFASFDSSFLSMAMAFRRSLSEYLTKEELRFDASVIDEELQIKFLRQIIGACLEGMKPEDREFETANLLKEAHQIYCINLNYTRTIDRFLEWSGNGRIVALSDNQIVRFDSSSVYHVHGTLFGNDSIFGVSNDKDIRDEKARRICQNIGVCIKDREAKEGGPDYRDAQDAIFRADRIILFGTSLGQSDSMWWDRIMYRMTSDDKMRVIMFPYSENPAMIKTKIDWMLLQNRGREMLRNSFSCHDDEIEMQSVVRTLDNVLVMRESPYRKRFGGNKDGDPFDLDGLSKIVVREGVKIRW